MTQVSIPQQHEPQIRRPLGPAIEGVEVLKVCWLHEGEAADLVRTLKYKRTTAAVTTIADEMAYVVRSVATVSLLTWVPCTPKRRRDRGFDPAELLARALGRRLKLRARPTLRRVDGQPQTSRNRQGRLTGPQLRPYSKRRSISGRVMLVDDVCTTGSTLRVASAVLRSVGSEAVVAVTATVAVPH